MCGGRILPDVQFDAVGDGQSVPAKSHIVVMRNGYIGARTKRGSKCQGDFPFKRIASDVAHLIADRIEALSFTLSDLDG
jgi:hypothetical protein